MFLYRKNIILVPSDYDGVSLTKGLLNFDCYDNFSNCTLRCYNLDTQNKLTLGVAIGKKLHKFEVNPKDAKNFLFQINQQIKNGDDISCVLLDIKKNDYQIVLWGSTQINTAWKSTLKMMIENEENFVENYKNIQKNDEKQQNNNEKLQNNGNFYEIFNNNEIETKKQNSAIEEENIEINQHFDDSEEVEKFIDKVIKLTEDEDLTINDFDNENKNITNQNINIFDKQSEIDFKKTNIENDFQTNIENENKNTKTYFDENNNIENIKNNFDEEQNKNFYQRIKPQIDKMFETNVQEKVLNEIIPNSKFTRVEFDDKSGYYVFGVIYDEDVPKYLCYGLPSQKEQTPPKEMSNLYQWLPIDVENYDGDGFYMMYQDAQTGQNISVDIV